MSSRRITVILLSLAVLTLGLASSASASAGDAAREHGLRLITVKHSLLGTHSWYEQTYRGLPVLGGYLARHADLEGRVVDVADGRLAIRGDVVVRPTITAERAHRVVAVRTRGVAGKPRLAVLPGGRARLVWTVLSTGPAIERRTIVDARTGRVIRVENLIKRADGTGRVFDPNPVVTLQNQGLTDQGDADHAALQPAYRTVTLTNLDGTGYLRGDFAYTQLKANKLAFASDLAFSYTRLDDRFEQVMAYHHVTSAQTYIQSLGFTDVNNEPQRLKPNTSKQDNSFYQPGKDSITLGTGGVDDGEDADITWHEYGHAIQDDQVPGFGVGHDAGSIGEGFGDYWAVTMSIPVNGGYEVPCVADWDAVSYTSSTPHCLRRVDLNLTTRNQTGQIHDDGRIWARALWDINQQLGRETADTIILEAQFLLTPNTSFRSAAQKTVNTAQALYGTSAANTVRAAFVARRIL